MALNLVRRRAKRFEKTFWSGLSLDELYQQFSGRADHPMAAVFTAALRESPTGEIIWPAPLRVKESWEVMFLRPQQIVLELGRRI